MGSANIAWNTVLYIEGSNKTSKEILGNVSACRLTRQGEKSVFCVGFSIDAKLGAPRPLARIGTNRDCDIVLPEEFGQVELCFNVNSYSGEIVLHANVKNTTTSKKPRTAVDFRRRAWDKDDEEVRDILVHSGTQWAVVLHPDLTRPTSQQEKRQYRLQVGKAEFLIHPFDYGLGEHCPLPRQLNYMKSAFGFSGRSEYHHAIHMGVIKNVPIRRLGKGAQGVVWHVISTRNGYHFAQKKIDVGIYAESRILRDGLSATDVLKDEVILLQEIQGKQCSGNVSHIVPYLHTEGLEETTSEGVQIVTVYMDVYEGSLADMIASGKFRNLNEGMPLLMRMVKHMAIALSTLSSKNAIHRDVKPENILYNGDNFYLTDFGLAKIVNGYASFLGTEVYQAPEVLEGESHTTKVDVFSLGVTIAACLKSMQPTVIRDAYKTHKQTWPTYVSGILSVFGESQLASLVCESPDDRPAAEEVLKAADSYVYVLDKDLISKLEVVTVSPTATSQVMGREGESTTERSSNGPMGEAYPPQR